MSKYNNDSTMEDIKSLLMTKDKEFLVNETLDAYWQHTDVLGKSVVWKELCDKNKEEWLKINKDEN